MKTTQHTPGPQPIAQSWLWPDHTIGKRESRQLREEHNALYNSHAALVAALEAALGCLVMDGPESAAACLEEQARAALQLARGES